MDIIRTIQDLLRFNGSAHPVTVKLTPSELSLVASAPDLLEALRPFAEAYVGWSPSEDLQRARAAIAKAEGK